MRDSTENQCFHRVDPQLKYYNYNYFIEYSHSADYRMKTEYKYFFWNTIMVEIHCSDLNTCGKVLINTYHDLSMIFKNINESFGQQWCRLYWHSLSNYSMNFSLNSLTFFWQFQHFINTEAHPTMLLAVLVSTFNHYMAITSPSISDDLPWSSTSMTLNQICT